MVLPELLEDPVMVPALGVAVHEKVAPETSLVKATLVTDPEHIVCRFGVAVTDGRGLTVTTTVNGSPGHVAVVGVTVYVAVPAVTPVAVNV